MTRRPFLALAVGALALIGVSPADAQTPFTACQAFQGFPLQINLGTAPLGIGGETPRCTNQKITDAINTLNNLVQAGVGTTNQIGKQSISTALFSQPPEPVQNSFFQKTTTKYEDRMEFVDAGEVYAYTGSTLNKLAPNNYIRSKVALYRLIVAPASGGDIYGANFVSVSQNGHSGNNQTLELDNNSYSGNAATTFADLEAGKNVHAPIYISGQTGSGTGADQKISGAILINLGASTFKPARGVGIYNGTVYGNLYDDDVTATGNVLASYGGSKAGGIDFSNAIFISGNALTLRQQHWIRWYSPDGTKVTGDQVDSANNRIVGAGANQIVLAATTAPDAPGTRSLGVPAAPWGSMNSLQYNVGAAVGVSCSGAPTGAYAVSGGIVTHC